MLSFSHFIGHGSAASEGMVNGVSVVTTGEGL